MNFEIQTLVLTIDEAGDLYEWINRRLRGVDGITLVSEPPMMLRTRSKLSVSKDGRVFWKGEVYVTGRHHDETYPVTPGTFAQELLRSVEKAFYEHNPKGD